MILGHIIAAEREFFARIWHAVQRFRDGEDGPVEMSGEEVEAFVGEFEDFERTMNRLSIPGIMAYYDSLHKRVLRELNSIRGLELEAPSLWWEELPISVEFRLHRLDSHLRQHTIQLEKTLIVINESPSEAKRLLRLVYAALSDVDSTIIGAWGLGKEKRLETAAGIVNLADEISQVISRLVISNESRFCHHYSAEHSWDVQDMFLQETLRVLGVVYQIYQKIPTPAHCPGC